MRSPNLAPHSAAPVVFWYLNRMSSARNLWVTRPKPNDKARFRLFCFPYAGAGAQAFRPWIDALDHVEVCPIQLPGRETRFYEALLTDPDALVATLTGVLYPYYLERPFAFFGHSLGAILAFELARSLIENYSFAPFHLFVSGRVAPQDKDPRPLIHTLPDREFVAMLRSLNGTPDEILNDPGMRPLLAMLRADLALNERYVYVHKDPLAVPITAFGGSIDPKVTEQELARWRLQTTGRFRQVTFRGDHFFINTERPQLLREIAFDIRSAFPA